VGSTFGQLDLAPAEGDLMTAGRLYGECQVNKTKLGADL
jgi:hypothetical protein